MNYSELQKLLNKYDQQKVGVYIDYLRSLESNDKNFWFRNFKASQASALYKKVAIDNLFIDGDTITLSWKKKVCIDYNYQAYKNRLLNIYPETQFDMQLVKEGDSFSFVKDDGNVTYTHRMGNPFDSKRKIIGTYCIIKNSRGQFIETLHMEEIAKMKNIAKTKHVWNEWEGEMILKSVIKRACKRHFKDVVTNIEKLDNENYELKNVDLDTEVQKSIEEAKTPVELINVYNLYTGRLKDEQAFLSLLSEKRKEIEDDNT